MYVVCYLSRGSWIDTWSLDRDNEMAAYDKENHIVCILVCMYMYVCMYVSMYVRDDIMVVPFFKKYEAFNATILAWSGCATSAKIVSTIPTYIHT